MMRHLIPICLAFGIASLATAGKPAATQPAGGAKGPTYTFTPVYKPGEKLLVAQEVSSSAKLRTDTSAMAYLTELLVAVDKGDAGHVKLQCRVRRIRFKTDHAPGLGKVDVDTDKPETLKGGMGEGLKMYTTLGFDAKLTGGRKLADVEGKGKYFQASIARVPARQKEQATLLLLGPYQDMLSTQWAYLPAQPVKVGQTWSVKRETFPAPAVTGTLPKTETVTCKLVNVTATKAGKIAEITVNGTVMIPSGTMDPAPVPIKRTGTLKFNLDTGKVIAVMLTSSGEVSPNQTLKLKTELTVTKAPAAKGSAPGAAGK